MADGRGGSSSPSPSNDEDCSDASGASGVGKPCKLPVGILGSRETSVEAGNCLKRLLDIADRDGKVAKAGRKEMDDKVWAQAQQFRASLKAKAKCSPKKGKKDKGEKEKEKETPCNKKREEKHQKTDGKKDKNEKE